MRTWAHTHTQNTHKQGRLVFVASCSYSFSSYLEAPIRISQEGGPCKVMHQGSLCSTLVPGNAEATWRLCFVRAWPPHSPQPPPQGRHAWVPKVPISAETALARNAGDHQPSRSISPGPMCSGQARRCWAEPQTEATIIAMTAAD